MMKYLLLVQTAPQTALDKTKVTTAGRQTLESKKMQADTTRHPGLGSRERSGWLSHFYELSADIRLQLVPSVEIKPGYESCALIS